MNFRIIEMMDGTFYVQAKTIFGWRSLMFDSHDNKFVKRLTTWDDDILCFTKPTKFPSFTAADLAVEAHDRTMKEINDRKTIKQIWYEKKD